MALPDRIITNYRIFVVENAVSELADMHFYTVKPEEIPFPLNDRYLKV